MMTAHRFGVLLGALLASYLLWPSEARAACNPLSLCSCTVTATGVSFGTYNPVSSSANDATGSVRVRCTLLVALAGSFTVDLSTGSSNSYAGRTLRNGTTNLGYNLYTTAARNQIWGNGTGGTVNVVRSFTALLAVDQTITVYGRIPARQNVRAGAYSDTIVVTVTY
ncbi:spore coat U domain-containing protein [Sphingomonas cannabina]|uniref:Csu type fimbrial protein n=1 Tax=Sphingomonas cannabina TaxID=2899123 RepID=UPI001F438A99|nr:spore coat U domain-containing protein [Sphingomonas cannabina]UIJ46869.1 spore coat U domain-containing protein [Sphingomonas cannabina]